MNSTDRVGTFCEKCRNTICTCGVVPAKAEAMVTLPEWHMKEIENTLRLTNNINHSQKKETCFDRCVCKAWNFAKEALSGKVSEKDHKKRFLEEFREFWNDLDNDNPVPFITEEQVDKFLNNR